MTKETGIIKKRRLLKTLLAFFIAATAFGLLFIAFESTSNKSLSYKESEANLNNLAARELHKSSSSLTKEDFLTLDSLLVYENELTNLEPLVKFENLQFIWLYLTPNQGLDLTPLSKLEKLKTLIIDTGKPSFNLQGQVTVFYPIAKKKHWYGKVFSFFRRFKPFQSEPEALDLGVLRELKKLEKLTIRDLEISNIEALGVLTNLEYLVIHPDIYKILNASLNVPRNVSSRGDKMKTEPLDMSSLANLTKLYHLDISFLKAKDYKFLEKLSRLKYLELIGTDISDIKPLSGIINLEYLGLNGTEIEDISPLANLKNLRELHIRNTSITDEQIKELKKALPELKIEK
jgi:internalin A